MKKDIVFDGFLWLMMVTCVTTLALIGARLIGAGVSTSMTTTLSYLTVGLVTALILTAWWTRRILDIFTTVVVVATNVMFLVGQFLLGSR